MADSGGYWLNLAEAQKLTESVLVPGVIEENIRRGGLLSRLPVMQVTGQSLKWNRENAERLGSQVAIGQQLVWTDNITYTQYDRSLAITYDQTPLNHFVESTYGNINNYEAVVMRGMRKGMIRQLEDRIIYGDLTYGTNEFDGLHAWAADANANITNIDIDMAEGALSLANLRVVEDEMRYGIDFWLFPPEILRRLSAFYQEASAGDANVAALGRFMFSPNQAGIPIPFWNGVPIVKSDYLVAEQANTGAGADARAKRSSGTNQYSVFAVKMGQVAEEDPGVTAVFGGPTHELGEFFKVRRFEDLEDYDAAGLRMVSYFMLAAGSGRSVGRVFDITDVAIVA